MSGQPFPPLFNPNATDPNYRKWRSIVLALFENYKFNYEILGSKPEPQKKDDVHPYAYLRQLKDYRPQEYFFGEKSHVHFNSYFAYGNLFTSYPMGASQAIHHLTLENYQFTWIAPLIMFSDWKETFPLIFSTDNNYFMECCNGTFLADPRYDGSQDHPILCPEHEQLFTQQHFQECELPTSLLLRSFAFGPGPLKPSDEIIRTLNFCLKLFQCASGILFALRGIFGPSRDPARQIAYLYQEWDSPFPELKQSLGLYRLNFLAFTYLSLHPAATALCYGLYRNKYGVMQSHRTAFYVRSENQILALKDHLKSQIINYIRVGNDFVQKNPGSSLLPVIRDRIIAALDLARMFGLGYSTNQDKGENIHINSPANLRPDNCCQALADIDYHVEHEPQSPLWRIFYDYCGEWWDRDEISQVLAGKGEKWEKLRSIPRHNAVRIFHKYAALFWQDNLKQLSEEPKMKDIISQNIDMVLGKEGKS